MAEEELRERLNGRKLRGKYPPVSLYLLIIGSQTNYFFSFLFLQGHSRPCYHVSGFLFSGLLAVFEITVVIHFSEVKNLSYPKIPSSFIPSSVNLKTPEIYLLRENSLPS